MLGAPLPGLPREPLVGGDAWAVLAVELAQREGASGDLHEARDLLAEIERRGGVLIGGTASLVARHLGVAQDLLGDEADAIATLQRAIALAHELRAVPELARARRPTSPPSTSGGASAATGSRCSTRRSPPSAASASSTTWPARSS